MLTTKVPVNARVLYRILTEKSRLGFGQYADATVGYILSVDEDYMVWLYCCNPQISLHKDILDRLGLPQIPKPGTDEELLKEYKKRVRSQYTEEEQLHHRFRIAQVNKKRAKGMVAEAHRAERYSKGQLQAINHGHGNPKHF